MSYQDELRARLDAVMRPETGERSSVVDVERLEQNLFDELGREFEFSSYDLDESDVLRTLKILQILERHPDVFRHKDALKLFYTLARVDIIAPKRLLGFLQMETERFKRIVQAMAKERLLQMNGEGELEMTLEGKSLAERIGIGIYL